MEPLHAVIGRPRAVEALELALSHDLPGCQVFVTGPAATGRRSGAEWHVRRRAMERPAPPDHVYVHNFAAPAQPLALAAGARTGSARTRRARSSPRFCRRSRAFRPAIEILTGVAAGERDPKGGYPEHTIRGRAQRRAGEFAEAARHAAFGREPG